MGEIDKKSLMVCTYKKSKQVSKELAYVSGIIVAGVGSVLGCLLASFLIGWCLWFGISSIIEESYKLFHPAITLLMLWLSVIPWWLYAGAQLLLVIPTYSFFWCLKARDGGEV